MNGYRRNVTPTPPSFEGRPLPRPSEDVDEQGLAFDLGTMVSRRRALGLLGLGLSSAGLAACAADAAPGPSAGGVPSTGTAGSATGGPALVPEIPEEMAGPFPGDGSNGPDVLQRSGVVRSDIRSSFDIGDATAPGIPLALTLTVLDLSRGGAPLTGAAVYVWQCDREGGYSLYTSGLREENYLRGVQVVAADGTVTFTSIFPGCYTGRWPHIHLEVYPDLDGILDRNAVTTTSQIALPESVCNAVYATAGYRRSAVELAGVTLDDDLVFRDDRGAHQMATVTGDLTRGYAAALTIGVDAGA